MLRDHWGNYEYLCYLEDDIIIHDASLFAKIGWFNQCVGDECVLQPHRYERGVASTAHKVDVDGDIAERVSAPFQNVAERSHLQSRVMGIQIGFGRPLNPHSGCFFLNAKQMKRWINQPYFSCRDASFVGPLESAATLGLMRTFRVYKPDYDQAWFLEVEHLGIKRQRLAASLSS